MEFNKELFEELLIGNLNELKNETERGYEVKYKILKQFENEYVVKISTSGDDIRTTNDVPIMNIIKSNEKMTVDLVDVLDSRLDSDEELGFCKQFILLLKFAENDKSDICEDFIKAIDNTCSDIKNNLTYIEALNISSFKMCIGKEEFDMKECDINLFKDKIIDEFKNFDFTCLNLSLRFYVDINFSTSSAGHLFDFLRDLADKFRDGRFYLSDDIYLRAQFPDSIIDRISVDGYNFYVGIYDEEISIDFSDVDKFINGRCYSFSTKLDFGLWLDTFEDLKEFCDKNK